jgi:hypothetical protein
MLDEYSNMKEAQRNAIKYLGKTATLSPSTRTGKKYMIQDQNTGKMVHFGQLGYEDFTKHKDEARRQRYLKRATNMRGDWKQNPYSPNNLSINILW